MRKYLPIILIFLLLTTPVQAGLFDPILDPIQNLFNRLKNDVEDELGRSRVGRELNRIVEDIDGVVEIVQEFDNLVTLAASTTTPIGFIALAQEYGHNPDKIFDRFKDRVDNLNNNQQLSNTEAAAVLQSVLEEPILPDGVYLGDDCIIDYSNCPDESENPSPRYRAHYWDY